MSFSQEGSFHVGFLLVYFPLSFLHSSFSQSPFLSHVPLCYSCHTCCTQCCTLSHVCSLSLSQAQSLSCVFFHVLPVSRLLILTRSLFLLHSRVCSLTFSCVHFFSYAHSLSHSCSHTLIIFSLLCALSFSVFCSLTSLKCIEFYFF